MATLAMVPMAEYLATTYRPDRDYIDGVLEERNVGEKSHSLLQGIFYSLFDLKLMEWRLIPLIEARVQTKPENFRVPDICLVEDMDGDDPIVRVAPFLCIEVLSREDTLASLRPRIREYQAMGTKHVWVVDPLGRKAYIVHGDAFEPVASTLEVEGSQIRVSLQDVFQKLDYKLSLNFKA